MKTIYWAVKLNEADREKLLKLFPSVYLDVYAEHMTIVFNPSDSEDELLMEKCGADVSLNVIGYAIDDKGQAVVVNSSEVNRIGGGVSHITISCNGVRPVYSNHLLQKSWSIIDPSFTLTGKIARFTRVGWSC